MKKYIHLFFMVFIIALSGCEDKVTREITYTANVPIYMNAAEFKSAVKKVPEQAVKLPGKICIKDNYLFVNEVNKGIHVYDNSKPESPKYLCFINIPGNVDIAVKDNLLYADSYIDLVAIDISDPANPKEVQRFANAFPEIYPIFDYKYPTMPIEPNKGIVVGWKVEEVTVEQKDQNYYYHGEYFYAMDAAKTNGAPISSGVGVTGSMARFAISGDVLYAINHLSQLKMFQISSNKIEKGDSINSLWNIETLFTYGNKLFIGGNNGMLIYNIQDSKHPIYVSQYNHITSCDPVVVNGDYAFVTLRSGNNCRNTINNLDVVSLKDINAPKLVKSYPLYNPHGLGIDGNLLFICDGNAGLKIYDVSDVLKIDEKQIKVFADIKTFDVIPYNHILIMTGTDGLYQYDYSDIQNIREISHIAIHN